MTGSYQQAEQVTVMCTNIQSNFLTV